MKVWSLPILVLAIFGGCRSAGNAQNRLDAYYGQAQEDGFTDRELVRLSSRTWSVAKDKEVDSSARFEALLRLVEASADGGSYKKSRRVRQKALPELIALSRHDDSRMARVIRVLARLGRFDEEEAKHEELEFGEYLDEVVQVAPSEWGPPAVSWARARHRVERDLQVASISESEREETRRWISASYRGSSYLPDPQWAADVRQFCSRSMSQLDQLVVGRPAPEIESTDFHGEKVRLSEYRGKIVVLSFWATWCRPCMAKFDDQRDLVNRMAGRPFALLGVNGDRDAERALAVARRGELNWRNFRDDPDAGAGECAAAFAVRTWPSVFVLDAEGIVRAINPGRDDLWSLCESLVEEIENENPIAAATGRR